LTGLLFELRCCSPHAWYFDQRQEQLEQSLKQVEELNASLTKEAQAKKQELDEAFKQIRSMQHHKERAKEFSEQLETYKEKLERAKKVETDLLRAHSKLENEMRSIKGKTC